jgi:hypothetical protein
MMSSQTKSAMLILNGHTPAGSRKQGSKTLIRSHRRVHASCKDSVTEWLR